MRRWIGPDRISALPDDLLLLAVARLRCARLAARTSVLAHWWRGLWCRLGQIVFHDVPFGWLEAALGHVDNSAVSLLEICVPRQRMPSPDPAGVSSLLNAAARLAPEKLVFALPGHLNSSSIDVNLSCFQRATSIELDSRLLFLRVPAGIDFPALETLSLSGMVPDLDPLLSGCPRLRTLRLESIAVADDRDELRVNSASLHELVVDLSRNWTRHRHVNIVAPVLKQLTSSFVASNVTISVMAPMVEKVRWDCSYCTYDRASIVFGLWRLEQVTLQTAERQGQLEICARAVRPFYNSIYITAKLPPN
ncbi:hypothetical protein VPH35_126149 [Triticum aestivum]